MVPMNEEVKRQGGVTVVDVDGDKASIQLEGSSNVIRNVPVEHLKDAAV